MSKQASLLLIEPKRRQPPACCLACRHVGNDWDEYYGSSWYCKLNTFLPTKKLSCTNQSLRKKEP